jgi:hypothetical protein
MAAPPKTATADRASDLIRLPILATLLQTFLLRTRLGASQTALSGTAARFEWGADMPMTHLAVEMGHR